MEGGWAESINSITFNQDASSLQSGEGRGKKLV